MPVTIMGAVTMKMTRRTSMTSTKGVTLISAIIGRSPPPGSDIWAPTTQALRKCRLTMFRKSAEKLSSSPLMTRSRLTK